MPIVNQDAQVGAALSTGAVLFVSAYPHSSPLGRYVSGDLGQRLGGLGWRVSFTSTTCSRLARPLHMVRDVLRFRNQYHAACVDVFSGSAFIWAELACAVLRRLSKPFVLILHGGDLPRFAQRHPRRVGALLSSAASVTCPSRYLLTRMQSFRPDLLLIPNGLDLKVYPYRQRNDPPDKLLWLRAFHRIYDPVAGPEVLAIVRQGGANVTLTMVGPDKGDGSLQATRQRAQELGVDEQLNLPGPIPKQQVPSVMVAHDVFINTTTIDNTPVSLIEAMASGLPVISTNVGGIPYLIENGKTGLLVPPSRPQEMASAIKRLVHEPELRSALSSNGRSLVESFDWKLILPRWEQLFLGILNGSPGQS